MRALLGGVCALLVLGASSVALAQAVPVDQGVVDDAMSPGAFLSPTALTEPQGTATVSLGVGADDNFDNSELTNVSASYAVSNQFTIGGSVILPSEDFRLYMLSAKAQIMRSGRLRLAAQGNLIFDTNSDYAGVVGGVASLCLDWGCRSLISGYVGVGLFSGGDSSVPIAVTGSIVVEVVPHVKLVGELLTGFATNDIGGVGDEFVAFYGVRFTHKQIGINLGFAKAFGDDDDDGPGELFASITGRLLPN